MGGRTGARGTERCGRRGVCRHGPTAGALLGEGEHSATALNQISQDHREAVRLARMCHHVPVGATVIVGFALLESPPL
jgi:hypothetical protein